MRRSNKVFSEAERRLVMIAVVAVVVLTALMVATGGLWNPSLGSAGQRGFAELPGVTDATPLG